MSTPTNPTEPVMARLVDNSDDVENVREQLRRREQELEQMRRNQENIVVGQVLGVENNEVDEEGDVEEAVDEAENESPSIEATNPRDDNRNKLTCKHSLLSNCSTRKKFMFGSGIVFVCVAVVVGVVVLHASADDGHRQRCRRRVIATNASSHVRREFKCFGKTTPMLFSRYK